MSKTQISPKHNVLVSSDDQITITNREPNPEKEVYVSYSPIQGVRTKEYEAYKRLNPGDREKFDGIAKEVAERGFQNKGLGNQYSENPALKTLLDRYYKAGTQLSS